MDISASALRDTIRGEMPWRKCPDCNGTGQEWWIEYALKERPHDHLQRSCSAQWASDFCLDDWPDYTYGFVGNAPCGTCNSVGYISNCLGEYDQ